MLDNTLFKDDNKMYIKAAIKSRAISIMLICVYEIVISNLWQLFSAYLYDIVSSK